MSSHRYGACLYILALCRRAHMHLSVHTCTWRHLIIVLRLSQLWHTIPLEGPVIVIDDKVHKDPLSRRRGRKGEAKKKYIPSLKNLSPSSKMLQDKRWNGKLLLLYQNPTERSVEDEKNKPRSPKITEKTNSRRQIQRDPK